MPRSEAVVLIGVAYCNKLVQCQHNKVATVL
jgi:hypothetical protein